jgi:rhamnosyltransferase
MSTNQAFSDDTVAVIVTYNPDIDTIRQMLASLSGQCPVVIIDNGSRDALVSSLEVLASESDSVELICLENNSGIAFAQNHAISHIIKTRAGVRFTMLLDHDSIPDRTMVSSLEETFRRQQAHSRVAGVGPVLYDPRDKKHLNFHKIRFSLWCKIKPGSLGRENPTVEVDSLNSSGTLLSNRVFSETGGFDDGLFIDHVETDWCFKAKSLGYKLFGTINTQLTHHMGDDVCYYWFFKKRRMPYRSPARHYYIVRNSMLLQKRSYVPIAWKISNILKLCFTFCYFGCYYRDRTQQRKQISLGFRDGLKGVTGAYEPK